MKIAGAISSTFIDYPGKMAFVAFASGCNYRCPACHSKKVVHASIDESQMFDEKKIFQKIRAMEGWIDGIVICGGEPTLQADLQEFAEKLRRHARVKLDTNGSMPDVLEEALRRKSVDYLAMDIKGPREIYPLVTGIEADVSKVEESMKISSKFPDYEFRTTVVPVIQPDGKIRWLSVEEAEEMAKWTVRTAGSNQHKYFLQRFVARSKEEMMDERLSKEQLPKEMHETPENLMARIYEAMQKHLPNIRAR